MVLEGNPSLERIELPVLALAASVVVRDCDAAVELALPAVERLPYAGLVVEDNAALRRVDVPRLTLARDIVVRRNDALEQVDAALLSEVPIVFFLADNPRLPACLVPHAFPRLDLQDERGLTEIRDNGEACVCEAQPDGRVTARCP